MNIPNFNIDQFITSDSLNALSGSVSGSTANLLVAGFNPGVVRADQMGISFAGTTATVTLPSPFGVVFSSGALAQAHGTVNGVDTQSYNVAFAGLVPASGSITAYCLASLSQIQQNSFAVIGPPPGHPDYNPNFVPYTAFANLVDSLSLTAATGVANNTTNFELFRVTLTAGSTGVTNLDTGFVQSIAPRASLQETIWTVGVGSLLIEQNNVMQVGGTWSLPVPGSFNNRLIGITGTTSGTVTVQTSGGLVYGLFNQAGVGVASFTMPNGGAILLQALNDNWRAIGGTLEGLGYPDTLPVGNGGTGRTSFASLKILVGAGAGNPLLTTSLSSNTGSGGVSEVYPFAGNPNGNLAGVAASGFVPPDFCWDTTDGLLWTCIVTGNAASAVWQRPATGRPLSPPTIITATGPYSIAVPVGASFCVGQGWSAGGGGGHTNTPGSDCASGGSAGAYGTINLDVRAGGNITGTVGVGGSGSSGAGDGGQGGNTTIVYNSITYGLVGGPGGLSQRSPSANSPNLSSVSGPWTQTAVGQQGNIGFVAGGVVVSGQGGQAPLGGAGGTGGGGLPGPGVQPGGGGGGVGGGAGSGANGAAGQVTLTFY